MGAMLVAAIHLRHRTFTAAMLAGAPAGEVESRVRDVTAEAFGRVAAAFPELAAGRVGPISRGRARRPSAGGR